MGNILRREKPQRMSELMRLDEKVCRQCHLIIDLLSGVEWKEKEKTKIIFFYQKNSKQIEANPCLRTFFCDFIGDERINNSRELSTFVKTVDLRIKDMKILEFTKEEKVSEYVDNIKRNENVFEIFLELIDEVFWGDKWRARDIDRFFASRYREIKDYAEMNIFFSKYSDFWSREVEKWKEKNNIN